MKAIKVLAVLSVLALFSACIFFTSGKEENVIGITDETKELRVISGALDYYKMLRSNVNSGEIEGEDIRTAMTAVRQTISSGNRSELTFVNHGPDNVGGRTRAILIDKDDYNIVYAGSVSGGLFKSTNRGSTWSAVEGFEANLGVSSMCQTKDGKIYVATGHSSELFIGTTQSSGMNGYGVYFSDDNGLTFKHIQGTEQNVYINEIVALGNDILIAGSNGLVKCSAGSLTDFTNIQGTCKSLAISKDESVIVASLKGNLTYISTNGGVSFENTSGNSEDKIPSAGVGRMEYAISHEKLDGNYYIYAIQSTIVGRLKGVYYTADYGNTWTRIAPPNQGSIDDFAPFGDNTQGNYNQTISVVKGSPKTILIGGIDLHSKKLGGNWELRSQRGAPDIDPLYLHADQHEMQWDSQGRLWIGNDGGIFTSDDYGNTFRQSNRGYCVTQFYRISASAHGDVAGGTQDNGTPGNYHNNHTYREHKQISGNDGFACDFSFMNRDVIYSTSQSGRIFRTQNRGLTSIPIEPVNIPASFGTPLEDLGPFHTVIELYENPNDLNSKDSILYYPTESMNAGATVYVPSATSGQFIEHILTEDVTVQDTLYADTSLTTIDYIVTDTSGLVINLQNVAYTYVNGTFAPLSNGDEIIVNGDLIVVADLLESIHYYGTNINEPGKVIDMGTNSIVFNVSWDPFTVQDTYQSWLAFGLGNGDGLWLTRNALRFSAQHDGFLQVGGNISGQVTEMEFSKDGDHLFVGTSTGNLYRLSGLSEIYSPNPILGSLNGNVQDTSIRWDATGNTYTTETTFELVEDFLGPITGITIENGNPDNVIISLGGYGAGNRVQRSLNATASNVEFNSISGNLPDMPCLAILMDRTDPDELLVGTDFGLWRSEDGGGSWSYCNAPFGKTPVFDLKQNWRSWDEGNLATGQVYIGTHGRGIWSTNEFLSVDEPTDNIKTPASISDLLLFPNPVAMDARLTFNVKKDGKGTVRVFNLKGQLIINMENVNLNEGDNIVTLGLSDLAKGTYVVNLTTNQVSKTTKFIKQ